MQCFIWNLAFHRLHLVLTNKLRFSVEIQVRLTCGYDVFNKHCFYKENGSPKKGRRVRKIEVPTNTSTEFVLEDMAADIQRRRGENLFKCARLDSNPKLLATAKSLEDAHQTPGTWQILSLQVPNLRSQCIRCFST